MKSMHFYGTKCAWREVHGRSIAKHVSYSRHIYLFDDLTHKSFFYLFNAVLSPLNASLDVARFKDLHISFDEKIVRWFLGTWTRDCQTYMSLACAIFIRRYLRAGQQTKWRKDRLSKL